MVSAVADAAKAIFLWGLEVSGVNRMFRAFNAGKVKTVLYHSIADRDELFENAVAPEEFVEQIRFFKSNCHVVPAHRLDDPRSYRSDRVNLIITFDDGFIDNRTRATELLRREGLSAIFFAIGSCLVDGGAVPRFVQSRLASQANHPCCRTIAAADAMEMLDAGMVIGSHGLRHDDYQAIEYQAGIDDASSSKRELEELLGVTMEDFAFPWGRYRAGQIDELLGIYRRIFTTAHGFNVPGDRVYFRNEIAGTLQAKAAVSGALDFFRGLVKS